MARIVVTEFVSLDGVIEEPGWTFQFDRGAEGDKFKNDEMFAAEAMLLGRVTYQGFANAWPHMEEGTGDYGVRMNTMPRYVVSNTLTDEEANWGPTTVLRGDVVAEVTRVKAEQPGNLLVHGSGQLVRTLIENGLVDEYRLMVFPIILGSGKRMYPGSVAEQAKLTLADSSAVGDGVLLLTYRPAPPAKDDESPGTTAS